MELTFRWYGPNEEKITLEQIGLIPACEECDVKMAIHPDDPPYSMFGLPRIIKNREDLDWLCNAVDSACNNRVWEALEKAGCKAGE